MHPVRLICEITQGCTVNKTYNSITGLSQHVKNVAVDRSDALTVTAMPKLLGLFMPFLI